MTREQAIKELNDSKGNLENVIAGQYEHIYGPLIDKKIEIVFEMVIGNTNAAIELLEED